MLYSLSQSLSHHRQSHILLNSLGFVTSLLPSRVILPSWLLWTGSARWITLFSCPRSLRWSEWLNWYSIRSFTSLAFLSIMDPRSLSIWLTGSGQEELWFPPVSSLSSASLLSSAPRSGTGDFLLPTLPVVWILRRTMSSASALLVSVCLLLYPNFLWQCEFLCPNLWLPV